MFQELEFNAFYLNMYWMLTELAYDLGLTIITLGLSFYNSIFLMQKYMAIRAFDEKTKIIRNGQNGSQEIKSFIKHIEIYRDIDNQTMHATRLH